MKIRFLKQQKIIELEKRIEENVEEYKSGNFSFLETDPSLYFEGNIDVDENVLSLISAGKYEEENCELMLSAIPGLTPYIARDERLWVYLTHTKLLNYARIKWPIPSDVDKIINHIRLHFFARGARGIERNNAASRLWWMGHLCERVKDLPLKDSLNAFLYRTDVRANIIERTTTSQSIHVFSAIIKMLHNSLNADQKLFERNAFRQFMKELNLLGGVKLLDALPENEIDNILLICRQQI